MIGFRSAPWHVERWDSVPWATLVHMPMFWVALACWAVFVATAVSHIVRATRLIEYMNRHAPALLAVPDERQTDPFWGRSERFDYFVLFGNNADAFNDTTSRKMLTAARLSLVRCALVFVVACTATFMVDGR